MGNPEEETSKFASMMEEKNPLNFDSSETMPEDHGGYFSYSACDLPMMSRKARRYEAKWFRPQYLYGSSMDRKTCIWSCNGDSWLDKSSGIMWVGVHGMDSICVVSRTGDLDIKRVRGNLKKHTMESFLHHFRKTIIAEIEDLEDPPSKFCRDFQDPPNKLRQGQCIKKPFGVVSVGTDEVDTESVHETSYDEYEEDEDVESILKACSPMLERAQKSIQEVRPYSILAPDQCDEKNTIKILQEKMETDTTFTTKALEYDEKKAITFLREKMESGVAFTMDETIQAAISAFQHLFRKKFKANEIRVTVMDPAYNLSVREAKDINIKELEIHDIEKHLAVINESGSGGSSGTGAPTVISFVEDDMDGNNK